MTKFKPISVFILGSGVAAAYSQDGHLSGVRDGGAGDGTGQPWVLSNFFNIKILFKMKFYSIIFIFSVNGIIWLFWTSTNPVLQIYDSKLYINKYSII